MTGSSKWMVMIGFSVSGLLIYLLAPILTPFMIAAVLAYICDPLVDRLEARKLPRTLAVVTVFVVLSLVAVIILLVLIPMIERQIDVFVDKLPSYINLFQTRLLPYIYQLLGISETDVQLFDLKSSLQNYWGNAGGFTQNALASEIGRAHV